MTEPTLYRVVSVNPYLDTEEEFGGLGLSEAVGRWEDLTDDRADNALADLEELRQHGDPETLEWVDPETGREVTLRPEVTP